MFGWIAISRLISLGLNARTDPFRMKLGEMSHPPQTPRHLLGQGPIIDGGFGGTGSVHPAFFDLLNSSLLRPERPR